MEKDWGGVLDLTCFKTIISFLLPDTLLNKSLVKNKIDVQNRF